MRDPTYTVKRSDFGRSLFQLVPGEGEVRLRSGRACSAGGTRDPDVACEVEPSNPGPRPVSRPPTRFSTARAGNEARRRSRPGPALRTDSCRPSSSGRLEVTYPSGRSGAARPRPSGGRPHRGCIRISGPSPRSPSSTVRPAKACPGWTGEDHLVAEERLERDSSDGGVPPRRFRARAVGRPPARPPTACRRTDELGRAAPGRPAGTRRGGAGRRSAAGPVEAPSSSVPWERSHVVGQSPRAAAPRGASSFCAPR